MAYTKTTWVEGVAPGISSANLNNLETQYDEAVAHMTGMYLHHRLTPSGYSSIGQGTWTFTGSFYYGLAGGTQAIKNEAASADADNISYKVFLPAGTYSLSLTVLKNSSFGVLDVDVDGVEVGSIDCYAAAATDGVLQVTGINVTLLTTKVIRFRVDGKHASSSDYNMRFWDVSIGRTA